MFPIFWRSLRSQQKEELSQPIMAFLATEYHVLQAGVTPNPVQSLLTSLSSCEDPPLFPPLLLRVLGERFNEPYAPIRLLEKRKEALLRECLAAPPSNGAVGAVGSVGELPDRVLSALSLQSSSVQTPFFNPVPIEISLMNSALSDLYLYIGDVYVFLLSDFTSDCFDSSFLW